MKGKFQYIKLQVFFVFIQSKKISDFLGDYFHPLQITGYHINKIVKENQDIIIHKEEDPNNVTSDMVKYYTYYLSIEKDDNIKIPKLSSKSNNSLKTFKNRELVIKELN